MGFFFLPHISPCRNTIPGPQRGPGDSSYLNLQGQRNQYHSQNHLSKPGSIFYPLRGTGQKISTLAALFDKCLRLLGHINKRSAMRSASHNINYNSKGEGKRNWHGQKYHTAKNAEILKIKTSIIIHQYIEMHMGVGFARKRTNTSMVKKSGQVRYGAHLGHMEELSQNKHPEKMQKSQEFLHLTAVKCIYT